ncbi:MAG TPA: NAD(P)-dependent oxidoreductase [Dehalococcoidia bacterium]|nr:NAD(P)-dependent oxidoreductase [Dehalococcoidia bacterium]
MRVGFIGLGNMGGPMAMNVLKAGHSLVVHDLRREIAIPLLEGGATWADSPKTLAEASEVIMTSLPGPREMEAVALGPDGILAGAAKDAVYIDLTTNSPTLVRRVAEQFEAQGVRMLDAPVSGGTTGAADRNLAVMVGGDEAVYERCKSVLDAIGTKVFYTGGIGNGQVAKLVHNCASNVARMGLGECFAMGVKAGVPLEPLWEAVSRGALGGMLTLHHGLPSTLFRDQLDPPSFALELARKDVGLATALGREINAPMPFSNLAEQFLIEALNRGWGKLDSNVVLKLVEERAGVQLRFPDV